MPNSLVTELSVVDIFVSCRRTVVVRFIYLHVSYAESVWYSSSRCSASYVSCLLGTAPELSMGWVDPWVGSGRVGSRFFSFWWVGLSQM